MSDTFLVRDVFNPTVVTALAHRLQAADTTFQRDAFITAATNDFPTQGFKDRSEAIIAALERYLPDDFEHAAALLLAAQQPELTSAELDGYDGFIVWPQSMYIAKHGLDHVEISLTALYEMTKRFSAEAGIRAFIIHHQDATFAKLHEWVHDNNHHVRRLVSEGTRSRLPWAQRLPAFVADPTPCLPLLNALNQDESLYVRRSVANHMNDIAKDNPEIAISTLQEWATIDNAGTQWIISHAARTLLKQGHPDALALLGYHPPRDLDVMLRIETPSIVIGEALSFSVTIDSPVTQDLMIDYVIHYVKANGSRSPKVFKWAKKTVGDGSTVVLYKSHSFRPMSKRVHYPGTHEISVQVNGKSVASMPFEVLPDTASHRS